MFIMSYRFASQVSHQIYRFGFLNMRMRMAMQLKEFLSDLLLMVFHSGRQGLQIHFVHHDVMLRVASALKSFRFKVYTQQPSYIHGKGKITLHSLSLIHSVGFNCRIQKGNSSAPPLVISEALVQNFDDYISYTYPGKITRMTKNPSFGLYVYRGEPYRLLS